MTDSKKVRVFKKGVELDVDKVNEQVKCWKAVDKWLLEARYRIRDVDHGKTFGFRSLDELLLFIDKIKES